VTVLHNSASSAAAPSHDGATRGSLAALCALDEALYDHAWHAREPGKSASLTPYLAQAAKLFRVGRRGG
jgi:hypothetical protein